MALPAVKANGTDNLNRDSFQSALSGEAAQIRRDGELAPFLLNLMAAHDDLIPWSEYPQSRDRQLIKFAREESIFAGAQYAMETRIKNLEFKVTGSDRAMVYAEKLLASGDGGRGLSSVIGKMMLAYDSQDNGWFVELVGAGNPDKPMIGRPLTYNFLDPAHCYRTFDPDYPVFYRDPLTFKFHRIHTTRIIFGASMPQTSATARGIGFCTLSRALRLLRVIHGITVYKEEKINGRFTRAIGYGKGITNAQLGAVLGATAETADSLGLTVYNGIPFFTTPQGVELNLLDLASVPDGFDTEKDTTLYVYALALAFGVDAREIWPASASGATKADASVQHMKAQGKGIADRIAAVEYLLTKGVLRGLDVIVEADFTDDEQDARRADMQRVRVDTFKTLVDMKALTGRQALALAVSEGIVNGDILATVEDVLVDIPEEKPEPTPAAGLPPPANGAPPVNGAPKLPVPDQSQDEVTNAVDESKKKALRPPYSAYYEENVNGYQLLLEGLLRDTLDTIGAWQVPTQSMALNLVDNLTDQFYGLLRDGVAQGFGVGLAGEPATNIGLVTIQGLIDQQISYASGFIADFQRQLVDGITLGLVGGALVDTLTAFVSRAGLYASAFWQAIWRGLGDFLSREAQPRKVKRMLDDRAAHCKTCPPKANIYPSFENMLLMTSGVPGDGSDDCGPNCRCWLEIETEPGSGDFMRWNGEPTSISTNRFSIPRRR